MSSFRKVFKSAYVEEKKNQFSSRTILRHLRARSLNRIRRKYLSSINFVSSVEQGLLASLVSFQDSSLVEGPVCIHTLTHASPLKGFKFIIFTLRLIRVSFDFPLEPWSLKRLRARRSIIQNVLYFALGCVRATV